MWAELRVFLDRRDVNEHGALEAMYAIEMRAARGRDAD